MTAWFFIRCVYWLVCLTLIAVMPDGQLVEFYDAKLARSLPRGLVLSFIFVGLLVAFMCWPIVVAKMLLGRR